YVTRVVSGPTTAGMRGTLHFGLPHTTADVVRWDKVVRGSKALVMRKNARRLEQNTDAAAGATASTSPALLDGAAEPALLWAVLSRTPGVRWVADGDLCCRFASRAATDRLGFAPGSSIVSAFAGCREGAETPLGAHERALAGQPAAFEWRCDGAAFSC